MDSPIRSSSSFSTRLPASLRSRSTTDARRRCGRNGTTGFCHRLHGLHSVPAAIMLKPGLIGRRRHNYQRVHLCREVEAVEVEATPASMPGRVISSRHSLQCHCALGRWRQSVQSECLGAIRALPAGLPVGRPARTSLEMLVRRIAPSLSRAVNSPLRLLVSTSRRLPWVVSAPSRLKRRSGLPLH